MERVIELLENILMETSDELVGNLIKGRQQNYSEKPTKENLYKLKRSFVAMGDREARKAKEDLTNLKKEVEAEKSGEVERKQKIENLKDTLRHGNSKQAEEEHKNAQLNQGLRNKLEKIYKGKSGSPVIESLLNLNISEECLVDIVGLLEEYLG